MVRVDLNRHNIAALTAPPAGPVWREVDRVARRAANAAKLRAPVDTGRLRASVGSEVDHGPGRRLVGRVYAAANYARFVNVGTGIYGPAHRVITPRRGKFLVFRPKGPAGPGINRAPGSRGLVFARSVRGSPKNPFLTDGLRDVSPWPVLELAPS